MFAQRLGANDGYSGAMAASQPAEIQTLEELYRLIRAAIVGKVPLTSTYDGRVRVLCPYILGRNKAGHVRILCLQIDGESVSGLERKQGHYDRRCLSLEKFCAVRIAEAQWQTAGISLRRPKCIDQVELEVTDQPEPDPQKGH